MTDLNNSQTIFKVFKSKLDENPDVKKEFEDMLEHVIGSYNTTIYENRFLVGGMVEYIVLAAFNAFDDVFTAKHTGKTNARSDIEVEYTENGEHLVAQYSIKGAFTERIGDIILINFQGDGSNASWDDGTIFVLAQNSVMYADSSILPDVVRNRSDSLVIPAGKILEHSTIQNEYTIDVAVPVKPGTDKASESRVASEDLAKELISKKCQFLKVG